MARLTGVLYGLFICFLVFFADCAAAQKLMVGQTAISAEGLPIWLAYELGIFKKNGLDAVPVFLGGGGPRSLSVILSGECPISHGSGMPLVNSNLNGSDLVMITGGTTTINYWLMTRPETKSPDQLKGGSIAIGSFGTTTDFAARFALKKFGLVAGKDVTLLPIGNNPIRLGALESGRVVATPLNPPASIMAQKKGLNMMVDISALGIPWPHTGAITTRKYIRERPDTVRRFVKSYLEAVHRIKTDRETGMRVMTKHFKGLQDREVIVNTYDASFSENVMPRKQYATLEGIKFILDYVAESDARAKKARPEDFVDMRFVKELDESGYMDSLYR
jgi:ABC-type nitrate/sulfonate/bicarbonate transport system substrate-binding protein